jgi:hypothetical protein
MTNMSDDTGDWHAVRDRVLTLAESDQRHQVFGALGHTFRLEAPVEVEDLNRAEAQWGVTLPADYRTFLLTVGAGGAGPFYGLVELEHDGTGWGWRQYPHEGSTDIDRLAEPFPGEIDPELLRQALAGEPDASSYDDDEAFEEAYEEWRTTYEDWYFSPDHTVGAVRLAHQGCATHDWLVVSGPHRGQVWTDDRASDCGLSLTAASFTDWYLRWLDAAEATPRSA